MKIGFIGAGKTGVSLGRYFEANNLCISGYYSKTKEHAIKAADYVNKPAFFSCEELVNNSDIIFITTPDGIIDEIVNEIFSMKISGKIICHCSGAKSSESMEILKSKGASYCTVHPAQAMSSDPESYVKMDKTFFTLEGDPKGIEILSNIIKKSGNHIMVIGSDSKSKYHGATAVASNLVVSVVQMAMDMLMDCGFTSETAKEILDPLVLGNVENICAKGTKEALTGPVERCDTYTVKSHLNVLKGEDREIYRLLSHRLVKVAEAKNNNRNYSKLIKLLEEEK